MGSNWFRSSAYWDIAVKIPKEYADEDFTTKDLMRWSGCNQHRVNGALATLRDDGLICRTQRRNYNLRQPQQSKYRITDKLKRQLERTEWISPS